MNAADAPLRPPRRSAWLLLLCAWIGAAAAGEELFGYRASAAPTLAAFPLWRDLLSRVERERAAYERCEEGCETLRGRLWRSYLAREGEPLELTRLWEINTFINTFPRRLPGGRWRTPLEFLAGGGDELEAAAMKYLTLRELGFDERRLALVLGRDTLTDRPHPLLLVTLGDERWVLDGRGDTVLSPEAITDYRPLFSLNATGRRIYLPPEGQRP